jgi:hypothetical protein
MSDEEKLKQLIIKESKLEDAIAKCTVREYCCLQSELANVRYKIECCKYRQEGIKARPENYKASEFLSDY